MIKNICTGFIYGILILIEGTLKISGPHEPVLYISPINHILLEDKQNQQYKHYVVTKIFYLQKTLSNKNKFRYYSTKNNNFENDPCNDRTKC